jgi:hypothetical protein
VSAPAGEALVDQIRQAYEEARAAGQPPPGRPTLAKLTGATDYKIRVALAELADAGGQSGVESASAGDDSPPAEHQRPGNEDVAPGEPAAAEQEDAVILPVPVDAGGAVASPSPGRVPLGAKVVSWTGFVFGSVMSVAANVLHTWLPAARMPPGWSPDIASQIGAAVWPLGLLLSVEVLSRVPWPRGWQWLLARFAGTGAVALGSAVISYGHVQEVLAAWGYGELASYVGPLVLDGLMVISGFALLAMSSSPQATKSTGPGGW